MVSQARKAGLESPFEIRKKRAAHTRTCDWPGCSNEGEFRTSKSPRESTTTVWYCTDHIREHNKAWNYFEGLTDDEVEAVIKNDTVWQRPTWKLGSDQDDQAKAKAFSEGARIRDDFGVLNEDVDPRIQPTQRTFHPDTPEGKAFALLDLSLPVTIDEVKARYKKLVKRHHPDANDGCKNAEETFKEIVQAYQVILKYLED
ncbi:J domain-containing protein [Pseudomonadota bacterium]